MRTLLIEAAEDPVSTASEVVLSVESPALEYTAAGISGDHNVTILDSRMDGTFDTLSPSAIYSF